MRSRRSPIISAEINCDPVFSALWNEATAWAYWRARTKLVPARYAWTAQRSFEPVVEPGRLFEIQWSVEFVSQSISSASIHARFERGMKAEKSHGYRAGCADVGVDPFHHCDQDRPGIPASGEGNPTECWPCSARIGRSGIDQVIPTASLRQFVYLGQRRVESLGVLGGKCALQRGRKCLPHLLDEQSYRCCSSAFNLFRITVSTGRSPRACPSSSPFPLLPPGEAGSHRDPPSRFGQIPKPTLPWFGIDAS